MAQTIEELLKSMYTLPKEGGVSDFKRTLNNSKETWKKIQDGSWADGMNFDSDSEKMQFLSEWLADNPYSNI